MASFTAGGREWNIRLTIGLLGKIKSAHGIDLGKLFVHESTIVNLLFAEPLKIVSALWLICEPQAKAANITEEDFGYFFGGDEVDFAVKALLLAAVDFYPNGRARDAMRRALPKVLADMEAKGSAELDQRFSAFMGAANELPESIPAS